MVVFTGERLRCLIIKTTIVVFTGERLRCLIIKTIMVVFTGERVKVFNNKNDYGGVHR